MIWEIKFTPSQHLYLPARCKTHGKFNPAVEGPWHLRTGGIRVLEVPRTLAARGLGGWPDKTGVPDAFQGVMPVPCTSERGTAARRVHFPSLGCVSPCVQPLGQGCVSHPLPGSLGVSAPARGPGWPCHCLPWHSAAGGAALRAEGGGRARGVDGVLDGQHGHSGAPHGNEALPGKLNTCPAGIARGTGLSVEQHLAE